MNHVRSFPSAGLFSKFDMDPNSSKLSDDSKGGKTEISLSGIKSRNYGLHQF